MKNTNYKNLKVWDKSVNIVTDLYKITENFPQAEKFWIVSQIRRACISIPSNIAEWAGRKGTQEFKQFLFIAKWSCYEVETQLIISKNLWSISEKELIEILNQIEEIIKMIQGLINAPF